MNKTVGKGEEKEKIQKKFLATPKDMVYSCFDLYPKSLDELLAETGLEIADLNQMILEMMPPKTGSGYKELLFREALFRAIIIQAQRRRYKADNRFLFQKAAFHDFRAR